MSVGGGRDGARSVGKLAKVSLCLWARELQGKERKGKNQGKTKEKQQDGKRLPSSWRGAEVPGEDEATSRGSKCQQSAAWPLLAPSLHSEVRCLQEPLGVTAGSGLHLARPEGCSKRGTRIQGWQKTEGWQENLVTMKA